MPKSNNNKPIAELDNAIEAQILSALLDESDIPHRIASNADPVYAGIFQLQHGWGNVIADEVYSERILEILKDLREQRDSRQSDI
ncbi:hypothetical protein [Spirochaeta dissipatitropha]